MLTYNLHPIDNYSLSICSRKNTYSMKYKVWAAHDKGAFTVWLYSERPTLDKVIGCFYSKAKDVVGNVDESLLPDVTFENSPVEYEIIFKKPKGE